MIIRQQIQAALVEQLVAWPDFPAIVGRSLVRAFSEDEGDQLVVHRGSETPDLDLDGDGQRACDVLVTVVTRADDAEPAADNVMAVAHPIIMAFSLPGVLNVEEIKVDEPKYASADYRVCMVTTQYRITYQVQSFGI